LTRKNLKVQTVDTVRASRGGHTFHERWAARRALQLIFPQDRLKAIAVEGLSTSESAKPGAAAEEVADLVLYYGDGENFAKSEVVQTTQFKYKTTSGAATASYLRKTIEKFADSIIGYEEAFSAADVDKKLTFAFVTNADFSPELWEAIKGLKSGSAPPEKEALRQYKYLAKLCEKKAVDAQRLFSRCEFRASEEALPALNSALRRTIADWSAGADFRAKARIFDLAELVREKAGPLGQNNNLIIREDVLVSLSCEPEDLFPADTRFIDVGEVVPRKQLRNASDLIAGSSVPLFIHAEGGVGKTVFVESLAATMSHAYEIVVFDCFGGGAYRSPNQARHLPSVGFVQLTNELASRGLCDPLLPGDTESVALANAMRRRLTQAAATLKSQSKKEGLLIVIDAADNAQLEADSRKDPAFPKLLLASLSAKPIDGVKLVLTARTHRMGGVVDRSEVSPFALLPFSQEEAEAFLSSRRKEVSSAEFSTAFSRSKGNARVLAYLVETWAANVTGGANRTEITVEKLIAEKCQKIFADLHVAGWPDEDVREFFAAISLLPPPIPIEELANALGWQITQVKSAASDLAPMLEIVPHGAIFRDEPTETYVRDTYSRATESQQAIAQRLQEAQITSAYAAEALPSFLVAIDDSDRAYALANSSQFPSVIQSDFGRRRLTLARLNAAFKLAVKDGDLDRVLGITMRLAQIAAANSRGDQFIRRSPSLAVILGDPDAYRRLFNDRSGWRGARDARLTVAHAFSNEMKEAEIHCDRVIGWINWNARQPRNEREAVHSRSGPDEYDFAAILFLNILQSDFKSLDGNLCRWNRSFALSVAREAIKLARQYECATGTCVLNSLAAFASSGKCRSFALKASLLRSVTALTSLQRQFLARSLKVMGVKPETNDPLHEGVDGDVIYSAFAALMHDDAASASRILRAVTQIRPSSYDYGERHGLSKAWLPILRACVAAWSQARTVAVHDLLPHDVKVTQVAKAIETQAELKKFLAALPASRKKREGVRRAKKAIESQFNSRECEEIARGIETVLQVIEPLQPAMLARGNDKGLGDFLTNWQRQLPKGGVRQFEEPHHLLSRTVGLGLAKLLLQHAPDITEADATQLTDILSDQRFRLSDRSSVLALFASRPSLHNRSGAFAQSIAQGIRKEAYIEQRGDDYASLAEALLEMSTAEAREYYRNGLSELDKLGSNDHDLIYAILNYAAVQPGGLIRPALGHRLMNLSQTICSHEPSKFGWALFARASARSVGTTAVTKLVRWGDQEVANFSYGLPQLACFLAAEKRLSPQRATALLTICKDQGWYEWRLGDGVADLLAIATNVDEQRSIFVAVFRKLKVEHSSGGWSSVWDSLLALAEKFPGVVSEADDAVLRRLLAESEKKREDFNARSPAGGPTASIATRAAEVDPESFLVELASKCDPASSSSIEEALHAIEADSSLPYFTQRRFFDKLRESCLYDRRLAHLMALAEATKIPVDNAIDRIGDCVAAWAASSAHIVAQIKGVIEHLFKSRGSELFNLKYGNISRELHQLTELCGDADFVLHQVLNTIAMERIELDGEDWLHLATTLCKQTSPIAAREALENLLSGPATGLADDIGEGPYQASFHIEGECALLSGIAWHLLGDSDAYLRWATARALSTFVDLGLIDELDALLDQFDRTDVPALKSAEHYLSFQNSQQWLLMGLARATLIHGAKLASIKPRLLVLASRADLHVLHKRHILRCLVNIGSEDREIASLHEEVTVDPKGIVVVTGWPKHVEAKSGFTFDYEFMKSEVSRLARLFRISDGQSVDAMANEIKRLWPNAKDMDFFPGHDRYRRERSDRHEFYREHVQKHGMLSAATTLRNSRPVARDSYDHDPTSPFAQWLKDYDVTFNDGSWLADHKDEVPENANANFMGPRIGNKESIVEAAAVFERLGLTSSAPNAMIPIFGQWRSPDDVHIRIVSALGARRGIIGRCDAFSKRTDHDLWLPMFWHEGVDDPHRQERPFESFIWAPDNYGLGVDAGEEAATGGAASRPRLGVDFTAKFGLIADADSREWKTANDELALRSQVWGEWVPDADNYRHLRNEDGEILWAAPDWLDRTLPKLDRQLVYTVTLQKYKSSRSYSDASGAKAIYVGTRPARKSIRFWFAKKASATTY
jgi:hypothetical protein